MSASSVGYPQPGELMGPFRIVRQLGDGGMGVVFEAADAQLDRAVALKIIIPTIGDDAEFRERFTREARAQASLDSPHVVQVYSFGEAEGRLYIASQLVPDGDLGQMLKRHDVPPTRVGLHLIAQVAEGLADAHDAGLVHRDIKPGNVLLRNRDRRLHAYIGDFGIARRAAGGDLTKGGSVVGTPSYMAPEAHTRGEVGKPGDIYALGCLLWAVLAGAPPYGGQTEYQIVNGHVRGALPQVEPTGPLAAGINRVLRTSLAKDPGERYETAREMREDLRAVLRLADDATPVRIAGREAPPEEPGPVWQRIHQTPTPTAGPRPPFTERTPTTERAVRPLPPAAEPRTDGGRRSKRPPRATPAPTSSAPGSGETPGVSYVPVARRMPGRSVLVLLVLAVVAAVVIGWLLLR